MIKHNMANRLDVLKRIVNDDPDECIAVPMAAEFMDDVFKKYGYTKLTYEDNNWTWYNKRDEPPADIVDKSAVGPTVPRGELPERYYVLFPSPLWAETSELYRMIALIDLYYGDERYKDWYNGVFTDFEISELQKIVDKFKDNEEEYVKSVTMDDSISPEENMDPMDDEMQ